MARINVFAGALHEREAHLRQDKAWLAAALSDPTTRFVPVWRTFNLIVGEPEAAPALLAPEQVNGMIAEGGVAVFLGIRDGTAHFALDVSQLDERDAVGLAPGSAPADLWAVGGQLALPEAALLAHARALTTWHARHRYCGLCGHPTEIRNAGHMRACTNEGCKTLHFPRTDPAVIMLIEHRGRCLMGRQKSWADGLYSTLAGFVEPGESLEEAVAREVFEEAGVKVRDVRYHSSQPWPFPSSIMLGFYGTAEDDALRLDPEEISDARWFTRDEIRDHERLGFRLPRPLSIARRLLEDWLAAA